MKAGLFAAKEDKVWLGAPPAPEGPGIEISPAGLVSWAHGSAERHYSWDEVRGLQVLVAEPGIKFPWLISWGVGLLLAAVALWSPREPEMLHVVLENGDELTAVTTEPYGYPARETDLATSLLQGLAQRDGARHHLENAAGFVSAVQNIRTDEQLAVFLS
ncbi:hypothetical protein LWF15_24855 [Kineosporia rhizophila]|uniref:hypothetical protein n=1 Tax=Kineosporia TaxID=49184 RepID=UPI001E51B98C|nr:MULTISPECIES: hypothetical protein [Kineosporia]MCE0538733.1 hypothetical protein [Kineosporia rhizophila]GLY19510.1 hypothetical protein Kisp01_65240 [Kineosporia sp. NBRC 101677]